ncbi:MAG TPA: ascorbate-dependent monooxygenase [Isosphaeraceae bacterium]|jgi:hypothetical protein
MARWLGSAVFVLFLGATMALGATPTYHGAVVRILREHCQECHRPGQVAPFALLSFEQARKRAADIAAVIGERRMPPWHASTIEGGPFRGVRVLSDSEIATLAAWAEAGAPEGDLADAPAPREFASGWALGEPDLVLTVPEPYALGAEGRDEHRVFVLPTGLTEGKWVTALDYRPGNPKVVHHILGAFDTTGGARAMDASDPGPGYATFAGFGTRPGGLPFLPSGGLSGWAPGKAPRPLPEGVGRYLPAGSDVLLQVHYHKSGKAETDASSIGLYFARGPIDKFVRGATVTPPRGPFGFRPTLRIPAGDAHHEVTGTWTAPDDVHAIAVIPHMHWLGKDFLLTAERPDGSTATLIRVDRWDFNWQDTYDFETPVALPRGTVVRMVAHFDNSAANPANPSRPPIAVRWGEQTTDEMCIGFLQLTRDAEHLGNRPPARRARPTDGNDGQGTAGRAGADPR